MQPDLYPLLDYLATTPLDVEAGEHQVRPDAGAPDHLAVTPPPDVERWHDWTIMPVHGGANNLVYRVSGAAGDFAAKFTIRDERDRAGREYAALQALQQAGLRIAPIPVLLDRARYRQPVVVQTWLSGEPVTSAPQTDAEWQASVEHYCAIHTITPDQKTTSIRNAIVNAASALAGRSMIEEQVARVPAAERPHSLLALLNAFDALALPTWPEPPRVLCRVDANCRNFIRQPGGLASVDWENSGWGDGAFEIAELMTHPMYEHVPAARWQSVIDQYAQRRGDSHAPTRIHVYTTIMLVWWVARLARYLYDMPRGRDARLVQHPAYQLAELQRTYNRYRAMAWEHIRAHAEHP